MLVEQLGLLLYKLFSSIFSLFDVPSVSADFSNSISQFVSYLGSASEFVKLVFPINMSPYFVIFLSIFSVEHGYSLVMWVLRKIPFIGIE